MYSRLALVLALVLGLDDVVDHESLLSSWNCIILDETYVGLGCSVAVVVVESAAATPVEDSSIYNLSRTLSMID
jgi:hypothetical protein